MCASTIVFFCAVAGISAAVPGPVAVFPELARAQGERIVSGWEAAEGQIPFQLSIRMVNNVGGVSSCGGTIIHPEWGLTAAHCTAGRSTFVIRAGAVNLTRPEILFETSEYYTHPNYNENQPAVVQPDDISLLQFGRRLVYSETVNQVRLQSSFDRNRDYDGVQLLASGWGRTWTNGDSPENMNWVYLTGVSNLYCRSNFGGSSIIQDSTICANSYNVSSQSTCQGDSGGPLTVVDRDGKTTQVGVSSFVSASGCHVPIPAGFIRPGHYHDWYYEVTGIDFDWEESEVPTTVGLPSTTEKPEVPTTVGLPSTTEELEVPSTVDVPTTTEGPEVPSTVGLPTTEGPDVPSTVDYPSTTEKPDVPSTVDLPTTEGPDVPSTVGYPSTTEKPDVPSTVNLPTTEGPDVPSTVGYPSTTLKPDGPSTVDLPTTGRPDGPSTVGYPSTTEKPDVPSTVGYPSTTEKPDVPSTVGLPSTEKPDVPSTVGYPSKIELVETGKQQEIFAFVRKFWFW